MDFGGNIGQASIEAHFNGAKKTINLDFDLFQIDFRSV